MTDSPLSADELQRYARHLTLPDIGLAGQERLKAARVLLIGAGGLGSPAALYLAAAGVGHLGVVDADQVELSNLQRQILHDSTVLGASKAANAARRLTALNPLVEVTPWPIRLTAASTGPGVRELIRGYDVVVDGSDNFPTRYLINDAAVLERVPVVYGSIFRFEGQVSLFGAPDGPCYRCLFADPPPPELVPSCVEGGVLGVLPGIIGSLQALEAIKWILGIGESTVGRLIRFDALTLRFRELAVARDPACPVCGDRPTITELIDYDQFCGVVPARSEAVAEEISAPELAARLRAGERPILLDVREPWEFDVCHLDGSVSLPLALLPEQFGSLAHDAEIVTICHYGMRSLAARSHLLAAGFRSVRSLAGGVEAWATAVDPTMRRY